MSARGQEEREVEDADISALLTVLSFGVLGTPFTVLFCVNDIPWSWTQCSPPIDSGDYSQGLGR